MNPWSQASDESESTKSSQRLKKSLQKPIHSKFSQALKTSMYVCSEKIFKSETKSSFYRLKTKT